MAGTTHDTSSHEHFQHAPDQTLLEQKLNTGLSAVERYSRQILAACLILVVAGVAYLFWQRSGSRQNTAAWTAFMECRSPEDYLSVADEYTGAAVGDWARLEAGKLFISEGLSQALTNRAASDASLKKAKDAYETLLNKKTAIELRQEALYGLATCLEALSTGENKSAIEAYETLLKEFPNSPHKLWAESRIRELNTNNSQSFYAWFRKQDPKPADRPGPRDIPSLETLIPDLEIPGGQESAPAKDGEKAPAVPAGAEMPEKGTAPAPEFPAEADKTPASGKADAKPADTKPVKENPEAEKAEAKPAPEAEAKPASPEGKAESKPTEPATPEVKAP